MRKHLLNALLRRLVKPLWRHATSIAQLRRRVALADSILARAGGRKTALPERLSDGVAALWFGDQHQSATRGAILYLHGGAFCVHLPSLYADFCHDLAMRTSVPVLLPDYRLAPEYPAPAALDDCELAYRRLLRECPAQRIVLVGDSAGGNLALALLQRCKRVGLPLPGGAVLLSPLTDFSGLGWSLDFNEARDVMFTHHAHALVSGHYLQHMAADDPEISPLLGDWSGLPPLRFHVSSSEMLLDHSLRATDRAKLSGVDAQAKVWLELPHVFALFGMLKEALQCRAEIASFILDRLASTPCIAEDTMHSKTSTSKSGQATADDAPSEGRGSPVLGECGGVINRVAIGDSLRRMAARQPDKVALIEGERRISYGELDQQCNRFANYLLQSGLKKGDAVATLCLNSSELLIASYAIAKAGLVWVPINGMLAGAQLQYILKHVEAKLVLADDELLLRARTDVGAVCPRIVVIPVAGLPVPVGAAFAEALQGQSAVEPVVDIRERDIAQIMYTSGTTAHPKGVAISHLGVYIATLANIIEMDVRREDVSAAVMPIFHCAQHALVASFLHRGASIVVVRRFEPEAYMRLVAEHKLSWIFLLPAMYRVLLDHPTRTGFDLSSLRFCLYAMQPMDRNTLLRLTEEICPNFALASGQTETYPASTCFRPEHQLSKSGAYWGSPSMIVDMAIMDDAGVLLAQGDVGELVVRGPNVMQGYYKDPVATAEASKFGWHHTGDLCFMDADGLVVFVDRKKDMIKTGGENVASITVESVLLGHAQISNAVVLGLPHPHWIEAVVAFVTLKPGASCTSEVIIDYCKARLARHEVPKEVVFVEQLPMTATGKLQKNVLREQFAKHFA
jgi:long-chain acyl-CoA synthetase